MVSSATVTCAIRCGTDPWYDDHSIGSAAKQVWHCDGRGHPVSVLEQRLPPGIGLAAFERMYPPIDEHVTDPAGWMHDKLGRCLWSKQVEILEAIRDYRMVAVQACHGPGKSFTASGAASWWLDVHEL